MRILLFGEYSGLFNSLKDGLKELGHEVFLASNGDMYRDFPSDYRWDKHIPGKLGRGVGIFNVFTHLNKFSGFDVVLVISTFPLFMRYFNDKIFDFLVKNNSRVYISGSGLHPYSFEYWNTNKETKYYNYTQASVEWARQNNTKWMVDNAELKVSELRIMNIITGYIPIMYEYSKPYENFKNILKTIPIPINISKFKYEENKVKEKIVFFHGITRASKGGEFIIKAFDKLSKKYPNDAEFICKGGLPFDEYMALLRRTNVVLDDVNAYSLGMNGLFSMAQGKIVMGGAEEVASKELNYEFCPAINLIRSVDQIVDSIENVIENKHKIEEMGFQSRLFVETYHDHVKVAQSYLDLWK
jgi:hypothetical protein